MSILNWSYRSKSNLITVIEVCRWKKSAKVAVRQDEDEGWADRNDEPDEDYRASSSGGSVGFAFASR